MDVNKIYVSKTLGDYEELLCNADSYFVRVHKAHIVNTNYILSVNWGEQGIIQLKNNLTIEVSRRKKQELIEKMSRR
jgi:two-component system, LytTR family, response regulator